MLRLLGTSLLMLIVAAPALAKPKDVYPTSCDELWVAVKDTLDNPRNYGIYLMNDADQKASFFVIGHRVVYTDSVALMPKDGGCKMKVNILEEGADNLDWAQFKHRVERSLAKLQVAKPKPV